MEHCYCTTCKSVQDYHVHEKQSVKLAAGIAGATTKFTGAIADQVQYEDDKHKHWRGTAELKLMKNQEQTNQMAGMSSDFTAMMAGGRFELRCNTCAKPVEYPQAQSFSEYKECAKVGFAHKNRWFMAILGCLLGAGIATVTKNYGANNIYALCFFGGGAIGFFSPRFMSPKVNSILNIVFSSLKLVFGVMALGGLVVGICAAIGPIALTIGALAYTAFAGFGVYAVLKDQIELTKEIFSEETEQKIESKKAA